MAIGNMLAAIVDAMRDADVPNDITHGFLDRLERLNCLTLSGMAGEIMAELVDVVRSTVPDND